MRKRHTVIAPEKKDPELQDNNEYHFWDRLPGETERAFAFFVKYRDLDVLTRNHAAFAKAVGLNRLTVQGMSHRFRWGERCKAYQTWLDQKKQAAKARELEDMQRRHSKHAQAIETSLMIPIEQFLNKVRNNQISLEGMTAEQMLSLVFTSAERFPKIVDSERKSRGVATDLNKQQIDITTNGENFIPALNIIVNGSKSQLLKQIEEYAEPQ